MCAPANCRKNVNVIYGNVESVAYSSRLMHFNSISEKNRRCPPHGVVTLTARARACANPRPFSRSSAESIPEPFSAAYTYTEVEHHNPDRRGVDCAIIPRHAASRADNLPGSPRCSRLRRR